MARDNTGSRDQPIYDPDGAPADAADLTEVGAYAAEVGNRKAGTAADRVALTGTKRWIGLEFEETDTGLVYVYTSGGWALRLGNLEHHTRSGSSVTGVADIAGFKSVRGFLFKSGQLVSSTTNAFGNEYFPVVAFDTPFPTACLHVAITPLSNSPITRAQGTIVIDTKSTTQFRALIEASGSPWIRGFTWFAIGI